LCGTRAEAFRHVAIGLAAGNQKRYQHTIQPLASAKKDGKTIVTARLAGSFPGSPIDVQFAFTVEAGKIVSLEIK
jgi:hypothetical protein